VTRTCPGVAAGGGGAAAGDGADVGAGGGFAAVDVGAGAGFAEPVGLAAGAGGFLGAAFAVFAPPTATAAVARIERARVCKAILCIPEGYAYEHRVARGLHAPPAGLIGENSFTFLE
jgi:hypothetical protein